MKIFDKNVKMTARLKRRIILENYRKLFGTQNKKKIKKTHVHSQGTNLISNIVWEKEDDYDRRDR